MSLAPNFKKRDEGVGDWKRVVYNRGHMHGCMRGTAVGKRGMLCYHRRVKHTPWQLDMRYCIICACGYSKENGGRADKDHVLAEQRLVEIRAACDGVC